MAPTARERILSAATRVARDEGIAAVTFERVAQVSGVSRGGIVYHFPSKEALLRGLHAFIAEAWEHQMERKLAKPREVATVLERVRAYLDVAISDDSEADIALLLDPSIHFGEVDCPWQEVIDRWTPTMDEAERDPHAADLFLVRLLADGFWVHTTLAHVPMRKKLQRELLQRVAQLLEQAAQTTPEPSL